MRLRQLCLLFASCALVPAASQAWEPPIPPAAEPRLGAEPSADSSVTNRSCTEQTLLSGVPYSGSGQRSGRAERSVEVKVFANRAVETGREAVARLTKADPFLEPGRQFLVLARFDGMREVPGEEEGEDVRTLPVLSVIGYVEPSANIVE